MVNGIFNNPAFKMEALTDSLLNIPFVPTQARSTGVFMSEGIPTTSIDLEFDSVSASLIPVTQRGDKANQLRGTKRTMRTLKVPHLQLEDTINPEALQNVREFGSTNQLVTAQSEVNKRMRTMALSHDMTLEYQSIGALKGVIYDADGSTVLYNLFNEFDVVQSTVDFTLGTADADILGKCLAVKRLIEAELGGLSYTGIQCFCGNDWFDAFVAHPEVREAYKLWQANGQLGEFLRADNRKGFTFGGITFVNYVGAVGSVNFVQTGEAHFFPLGVIQLFRTVFAPGNFWETVNTTGLPRYARMELLEMGRGAKLLTESNPLCYCTRPKVLVKGTTSN